MTHMTKKAISFLVGLGFGAVIVGGVLPLWFYSCSPSVAVEPPTSIAVLASPGCAVLSCSSGNEGEVCWDTQQELLFICQTRYATQASGLTAYYTWAAP